MHIETESQNDLQLALNNNKLGSTLGTQRATNVLLMFDVQATPPSQPRNPASASPRSKSNA